MGTRISKDECKVFVESSFRRTWSYSNLKKPERHMVIKYGGEWLGWFMLSEPIRVSLIHEFEEPLLIQINVWTFNKGKWMERDEFIAPKVVPGISYRYPQMKYKPGVFKMRINAFCKSKQVFSQTISFSYNRTA